MQQINTEIQTPTIPFIPETDENEFKDESAKTRRWTRDEYHQMAEMGFFDGKRVELIEGEIIEMAPMKSPHMTGLTLTSEVLRNVFSDNFTIRVQGPLSFDDNTEPEPDIAVVKGKIRDFSDAHPKTAVLVVEVSDATLQYDRTKKMNLYAKNRIQEYWILNVKNRSLEVYRRPIQDQGLGFVYTEIQILTEKDSISPLTAPESKIKIADLLP